MKPDASSGSPRSSTKIALVSALGLILLALLLWKGDELAKELKSTGEERKTAKGDDFSSGDEASGQASLRSKVSQRSEPTVKPTHSPAQLKDFFLPEVDIDGLTLAAALQKLKAAYEEVCRETGEVPIPLAFDISPGKDKALHLKLGAKHLDGSIRMLAAASGLTVRREGSTYHLEEPARLAERSKKSLPVPPDIVARLGEIGGDPSSSSDLRSLFEAMGIKLDPSTRIEHSGMNLQIETDSSADLTALSGITDQATKDLPMQQKLETKMMEIPAGVDWTTPDPTGQYNDAQIQLMMREISQTKGIDLLAVPSVTARNGETGTIEIIRELIYPTDDSGQVFESQNVGHVMKFGGSLLGLGQKVDVDYTDTAGDIDPATGRPRINTLAAIKDTSYIGDGSTKLHVQTRPDGSRRVMFTTMTRIDATGRPVKEPQ